MRQIYSVTAAAISHCAPQAQAAGYCDGCSRPLDAAEQRIDALAGAIIRALSPGNGRSNLRDSEEELIQRLDQEGVIYDAADLPAALSRLEAGEVPGQSWKLLRPTAEAAVRVRAMSATSPGA